MQFVYINNLLQTEPAGGGHTTSDKDLSSESSQVYKTTREAGESKELRREGFQERPEGAKDRISKQVRRLPAQKTLNRLTRGRTNCEKELGSERCDDKFFQPWFSDLALPVHRTNPSTKGMSTIGSTNWRGASGRSGRPSTAASSARWRRSSRGWSGASKRWTGTWRRSPTRSG